MTRSVRRRAWLAAAAVVVAGAGGVVLLPTRYGDGGPLARTDEFAVHIPGSDGEVFTWGTVLPRNETLDPVRIESIEVVNASSIEVVGLGVNDPDAEGAIGTAHGYPPAGMEIADPEGQRIAPAREPREHLQVIVGVRLNDSSGGRIGGIRVRYEHAGTLYEDVLPYSLGIGPPADD